MPPAGNSKHPRLALACSHPPRESISPLSTQSACKSVEMPAIRWGPYQNVTALASKNGDSLKCQMPLTLQSVVKVCLSQSNGSVEAEKWQHPHLPLTSGKAAGLCCSPGSGAERPLINTPSALRFHFEWCFRN